MTCISRGGTGPSSTNAGMTGKSGKGGSSFELEHLRDRHEKGGSAGSGKAHNDRGPGSVRPGESADSLGSGEDWRRQDRQTRSVRFAVRGNTISKSRSIPSPISTTT